MIGFTTLRLSGSTVGGNRVATSTCLSIKASVRNLTVYPKKNSRYVLVPVESFLTFYKSLKQN